MVYNADKNMLHNYMSGEKILPPQVCGKKVLPNPNQIPFNPLSQMVGALGAQSLISLPQFGGKEPATRERERKKSRLGQTQFDVFNKRLKYTWFSTFLTGKCLASCRVPPIKPCFKRVPGGGGTPVNFG